MSWEQLLSINAENAALIADFNDTPPIACPNDGEPLSVGANGRLYCPCGDWQEGDSIRPANTN